jgi:hypothetical protein
MEHWLLDTGVTAAEVIHELRALRESFSPKFKFDGAGDALALINVFGAFK